MTNKETILAFIERINAHNVEGLGALMSGAHRSLTKAFSLNTFGWTL